MSLLAYKILAALIILFTSIVAIIYPIKTSLSTRHKESLELGEAFASGIFLGVAFFHMFPASIASFQALQNQLHYPVAESICILGFIVLLFLERLSMLSHSQIGIPYILTLMLIIHSLIEGGALGLNSSFTQAFMIFIAIIAHKGSSSFALCVTLIRNKISFKQIILLMTLFSLSTPLGIFFGASIPELPQGKMLEASFNAFATGSFFYMATLHHVQFHKRATQDGNGLLEFFLLCLGLGIMAFVAIWV